MGGRLLLLPTLLLVPLATVTALKGQTFPIERELLYEDYRGKIDPECWDPVNKTVSQWKKCVDDNAISVDYTCRYGYFNLECYCCGAFFYYIEQGKVCTKFCLKEQLSVPRYCEPRLIVLPVNWGDNEPDRITLDNGRLKYNRQKQKRVKTEGTEIPLGSFIPTDDCPTDPKKPDQKLGPLVRTTTPRPHSPTKKPVTTTTRATTTTATTTRATTTGATTTSKPPRRQSGNKWGSGGTITARPEPDGRNPTSFTAKPTQGSRNPTSFTAKPTEGSRNPTSFTARSTEQKRRTTRVFTAQPETTTTPKPARTRRPGPAWGAPDNKEVKPDQSDEQASKWQSSSRSRPKTTTTTKPARTRRPGPVWGQSDNKEIEPDQSGEPKQASKWKSSRRTTARPVRRTSERPAWGQESRSASSQDYLDYPISAGKVGPTWS